MVKRIHADGVDRDMTPEEKTANDVSVAKWKTEEDAAKVIAEQKEADKASGNQKLLDLGLSQAEVDALTK